MNDARTSETDIKQLYERFHDAYRELREAWIKTGGGMDMEIKIRDAAAEVTYQRRCEAAKKGGAKRRLTVVDSPSKEQRSSSAVISDCGLYRYTLTRDLGPDFDDPAYHGGSVLWVMLNPSTADATKNDPTIRRCIAFSKAWGRDWLHVVNLYAYRATLPNTLWLVDEPVGPENDNHIERLAEDCNLIICAWGNPGPDKQRAKHVRGLLENRGPVHHLRLNKDGSPGHPLYLPKAIKPTRWV